MRSISLAYRMVEAAAAAAAAAISIVVIVQRTEL